MRIRLLSQDQHCSILLITITKNDHASCWFAPSPGFPSHRYPPNVALSKLINNLKAVSSKLICQKFAEHVNRFYSKPVFWTQAYCIISAGGAPLDVLKTYIQSQDPQRG
ncbi:MAG TPA: transposase [Coleofasciculaceae cyanobacterium]